jgi:hypothetical protein
LKIPIIKKSFVKVKGECQRAKSNYYLAHFYSGAILQQFEIQGFNIQLNSAKFL